MIRCLYCESTNWRNKHICPIDPANDRFQCENCGKEFTRYEKRDDDKKPCVWIRWGGDESTFFKKYEFNTLAELNAFLTGVDEADGWYNWEQFDNEPIGEEGYQP